MKLRKRCKEKGKEKGEETEGKRGEKKERREGKKKIIIIREEVTAYKGEDEEKEVKQ